MMKVYKWQQIAFIKYLEGLLSRIGGENINFTQFRLLADQAHLIFATKEEQSRCVSQFQRFGYISKRQLVSCLALVSIYVKHNEKHFIVRLRKTNYQLQHSHNRCFDFWVVLMKKRYGPTIIWFQELCQEKNIRRVSLQSFLNYLKDLLKGTEHSECAKRISSNFQKTKQNYITFSVFMNTINVNKMTFKNLSELSIRKKDSLSISSPRKYQTQTHITETRIHSGTQSKGKSRIKTQFSMNQQNHRYLSSLPLKDMKSSAFF